MQLFNTASRTVEVFTPSDDNRVTLYTCGPTVYSEPLLGNWVAYVRWDILVRTLKLNGYIPLRVMNITDVGHLVSDGDDGEDKMEKGARREGTTAWEVADRYTNRFLEGMMQLNLLPPEILAKATEHIAEQIDLITRLEAGGHTYRIDDGIYFDTATFPAYASFAGLDLKAMQAGARVAYNQQKRNPSDFALWKFSPAESSRDMEWESPWGKGFPGWHIECSAMALKYLGETIDIHTGGIDHIPVHHTNEIAQSEAATGKPFARYWLHANFLLIDGTKISKSLGNGHTLADLVEHGFSAQAFRMFVLQSHYRSESNFTWENLEAANNRLSRWRSSAALRHQLGAGTTPSKAVQAAIDEATNALSHDLGTPQALQTAETALDFIEQDSDATTADVDATLTFMDDALGLDLRATTPELPAELHALMSERAEAREQKDWKRSDELRDTLSSSGVGINDGPNGSRWYYL
jgi:cysteinyl-tRNA synthetase